jgi:hypothetical protein
LHIFAVLLHQSCAEPCCACCAAGALQEEVLARSQSKQFYQHLITLFQQLKTRLVTSRPCFLLPRAGVSSTSASYGAPTGGLLAVSCALDDDLVCAEELCLNQQVSALSMGSDPTGPARISEGGNSTPTAGRLGSYNIFNGNSQGQGGKPGLGVFIAGSAASGTPVASQGPALVVAAGAHQVLLPQDAEEGKDGGATGLQSCTACWGAHPPLSLCVSSSA